MNEPIIGWPSVPRPPTLVFSGPGRAGALPMSRIAHRRPVAEGQHHIVEGVGLGDLIVAVDGEPFGPHLDVALGRIGRGVVDGVAHVFEGQPGGGKPDRVDLDTDRRLLLAEDAHLADAGKLRHLLQHQVLELVVEFGQRHDVGLVADADHRRVGRVDLVEVGRRRQGLGAAGRRRR